MMSMLSAQCKRLRDAANGLDAMSLYAYAREIRDAADTIDELRMFHVTEKTCHLVTESASAQDWPNNERCDQCGEYIAVVSPEVVRYCPSCGRRIVE